MKRFLAPILLLTLLFPSHATAETMDDLVVREDLYYKKFAKIPYTGKVTTKVPGWKAYFVTGKVRGSFKDGKRDGSWAKYYPNGRLFRKGTFKEGKRDGLWVKYYPDGMLEFKGTYRAGRRNGPHITYHDNGQLSAKGAVKGGKAEGPWLWYNKDGTVLAPLTGTYKGGVKD